MGHPTVRATISFLSEVPEARSTSGQFNAHKRTLTGRGPQKYLEN